MALHMLAEGLKVRTRHEYPPIPCRKFDWCAVDDSTYDGAPDSNCPIGWGASEQAAIADLLEEMEMTVSTDDFNGALEPMRAIRDLISACETVFGPHEYEQGVLSRAQAGFTALRALHGDTRPGEALAEATMREPDFATLQLTAGALRCVARALPDGERHVIIFTGKFAHLGAPPISAILDMANEALGPSSPPASFLQLG